MKKKLLSAILSTALILQSIGITPIVKAATETNSPYTSKTYTHNDVFDGKLISHGIDVSKYNTSIDWEKVKTAGIEFAIIRVGYRGYGSSGTLCSDPYFTTHIEGALAAGLKVGVYYFTEAINTDEAIEEANYCLDKIKDYDVTMPVVIDYEFPTSGGEKVGRMYNANLSKSAATKNVKAFCATIQNAGYTPMVYANKSDFSTLINGKTLGESYKIWLANYTTKTTYANTYDYWQYSSSGTVDGIEGRVDVNFWYHDNEDDNNRTDIDMTPTPSTSTEPSSTPKVTAAPKPTASPEITATPKPTNTPAPTTPAVENKDPVKIKEATIDSLPVQSYNGRKLTPSPVISYNGVTLIEGTDYTLSYKNNIYPGKATITIKGTGQYTGTVKKTFTIKLSAPQNVHTDSTSRSITLKWQTASGLTGYQIDCKNSYNGSYKRVKTLRKAKSASQKFAKLSKDREYYYRIRSYVKTSDKTYYSPYTKITTATLSHEQAGVTKKAILFRKTPSSSGKKVIQVPKSAIIVYLGRTWLKNKKTFYHLQYSTGKKTYEGYATSISGVKFYKLGTTTNNLNLRKAAGTSNELLTIIPKGTPLPLLKSQKVDNAIWYQVQYYDGKKLYKGYVHSDYIN